MWNDAAHAGRDHQDLGLAHCQVEQSHFGGDNGRQDQSTRLKLSSEGSGLSR